MRNLILTKKTAPPRNPWTPPADTPTQDGTPLLFRRMIVGQVSRQGEPITTVSGSAATTFRSIHKVYASESDQIAVTYTGHWLDAGASLPMRASIRVHGKTHPLTFAGSRDVTLTPSSQPMSDPVALPARVTAGEFIEVRTYYGGRSDGKQYQGGRGYSTVAPAQAGDHTADDTDWPTAPVTLTAGSGYGITDNHDGTISIGI